MLGMVYYQKGEVLYALPHFQRAVELDPEDAEARFQFGLSLAFLEQVDEAIKQFEQAQKLDVTNPDIYYNLGVAFAYKDDDEKALAMFEKALDLQADHLLAANGKKLIVKKLSKTTEND